MAGTHLTARLVQGRSVEHRGGLAAAQCHHLGACRWRLQSAEHLEFALAEQGGQHPVGHHGRHIDLRLAVHPVDQFDGLDHRHLLRGGDHHQAGAGGVVEDLEHPVGLVAHQAHLHQLADHRGCSDLGDDVPAGLGVDHHQVVVPLAHLVTQLADGQDLFHPGRRVGDEVEGSRQRADAGHQRDTHEQPQVFAQRVLGVHLHRPQPLAHLRWSEPEWADIERGGQAALGIHLAHEGALAEAGGQFGQRCSRGGLADPAFAGDEQQAAVEQCQAPNPILRVVSAEPISM